MMVKNIFLHGLTPLRAVARDWLVVATTICTWIGAIYASWSFPERIKSEVFDVLNREPSDLYLWLFTTIAVPLITFPVSYFVYARILSARRRIRVTAQEITFLKFLIFPVRIDRSLPHRWLRKEHAYGEMEKHIHRFLRSLFNSELFFLRRYWQRSFVISIESNVIKKPVCAIYGNRVSEKSLQHLNAALALVDGKTGTGKGSSANPEDLWAKDAGDL